PGAALAACPGEVLLSCPTTKGRVIEVCATVDHFTYSYGRPGAPELALSVPVAQGPVTPWPGVGQSIWSTVTFHNAGHDYEIWIAHDRTQSGAASAGVSVLRGG